MSAPTDATGEVQEPVAPAAESRSGTAATVLDFATRNAVLVLFVVVFVWLSFASSAFLKPQNIINILNQNAPLAIVATAGTLIIISGGFDLSTGAIFAIANCVAAWIAVTINPLLGLVAAPIAGAGLGLVNGLIITRFRIHSFLATLATSLMYQSLALFITGGFLITVSETTGFTVLGRGQIGPIYVAIFALAAFAAVMVVLLNRTTFGRYIFAVGGNEEAALLSGVRVNRIKMGTFALSGLAAGLAGTIEVSRIASAVPTAGSEITLQAIAAIILGGTSIYGGAGAIWRTLVGVYLLALIANGFNILNANPFFIDLTTGIIIVAAVALSASRRTR
jgi:Ribose/xylose/arabinose/galactoside ABC-type transport systems, permease components